MNKYVLKRISLTLILSFFGFLFSYSQAVLPLSRTAWDVIPAGWTDSGTGSYLTSFACTGTNMGQFNGTGDYYEVFFTGVPDQLNFALKSASMSGASNVLLEESPDGISYSTITTYGPGGVTTITGCANINITLNSSTRYVRWTYTKQDGNCGIDDVSITAASCSDPTTPASVLTFPSTNFTTMDIGWTNGDGTSRLVVMSTSAITAVPTDGGSYTASTVFAGGTDLGTNEYVVYSGTGNSVTVTGLTENTTYFITVFEYNTPGNCYLTSTPLSGSETTLTVVPTELRFTANPVGCIEEGQTFTVIVCATDASGNIATNYTGNVTISVNTGSGSLTGTVTVAATSGCVTFNDLVLSTTDTYTLDADDGSLTTGTSSSFYIPPTGSCPTLSTWQGLIINEASNGVSGVGSGEQEYYEFVVAGECGAIVDIRGWILDDNNGTFTTGWPVSSGVAQGHFRLTTNPLWATIPVGSVVVIYNAGDPNGALPADDPLDSDNDSLYVIPHNYSALLEYCSSQPYYNGVGDWDSTYTGATYAAPVGWSGLGMRNAGDAMQVRSPEGSYWHGISYGDAVISGGPDNLKLSTSTGSSKVFYFNDSDYKVAANWSVGTSGTADETPGLPNNAANLAWLREIRDPLTPSCVIYPPMAIEHLGITLQHQPDQAVLVRWEAIIKDERGSFLVERSVDGEHFEAVEMMEFSEHRSTYSHTDQQVPAGKHYYRITFVSIDGKKHSSAIKTIQVRSFGMVDVYPNPAKERIQVVYQGAQDTRPTVTLIDMLGQEVLSATSQTNDHYGTIVLSTEMLPAGAYTLILSSNEGVDYQKITIRK